MTLRAAVTARNTFGSSFAAVSAATAKVQAAPSCPTGQFLAQYFKNTTLTGTAAFSRCETGIDHNWGIYGPGNGIPNDYFSGRWSGGIVTAAGWYSVYVTADDGVRVWVDGKLMLDKWFDQIATTYRITLSLSSGTHQVVVEYYERTGQAVLEVNV